MENINILFPCMEEGEKRKLIKAMDNIKEIKAICELECKNECMNMAECKIPYCESLQGRILRVIGE